MTTQAHQFINDCIRAITIFFCGSRQGTKRYGKEAKTAHQRPSHRKIVFFEMP